MYDLVWYIGRIIGINHNNKYRIKFLKAELDIFINLYFMDLLN